ncbi:MAG TPA: O-acetyl-ADP-ribose deacetylase [Candidatus Omnitrophica bacterium]|nr:O-acetyl-ADP-ribose deacetylase [Candidatus Omnitrophota bacterium]
MEKVVNNCKVELIQGDITEEETDAIVNAANNALRGGGGVDGAIHRKGGRKIYEECARIGWCDTGDAKITSGGNLPAKYVIHTVGPIWRGGGSGEEEFLASCYRRSLEVARENNIRTIAFPSISTGAYGYPIKEAANVALKTILEEIEQKDEMDLVRMVLFSPQDFEVYKKVFSEITAG